MSTECSGVCSDGQCVGDTCAGIVCNSPPSPSCDDASHLRVYAEGTCADATCSYAPLIVECDCVDGACVTDRCIGKTCSSPPPNECLDSTTLKRYATAGACNALDGTCGYGAITIACTNGCSGGACLADPCADLSCETPPAPTCGSSTVLRTFSKSGSCSSGACSYAALETPCAEGTVCSKGACKPQSSSSVCVDRCDPHATCAEGTRQCTCAPGYSGDGTHCEPADAGTDAQQ